MKIIKIMLTLVLKYFNTKTLDTGQELVSNYNVRTAGSNWELDYMKYSLQ